MLFDGCKVALRAWKYFVNICTTRIGENRNRSRDNKLVYTTGKSCHLFTKFVCVWNFYEAPSSRRLPLLYCDQQCVSPSWISSNWYILNSSNVTELSLWITNMKNGALNWEPSVKNFVYYSISDLVPFQKYKFWTGKMWMNCNIYFVCVVHLY